MKAKKVFNKASDLFYVVRLYVSIISSILIGVFHIISFTKTKSYITFFYMIFCFAYAFTRIIIHLIRKKIKILYFVSALLMIVTTTPLGITITLKTNANDRNNVIIMAVFYSVYALIKFTSSLIKLVLSRNKEREDRRIIPYFSMLSALYTLFMLVYVITKLDIDVALRTIVGLHFMLWFILLYALVVVIYFICVQFKIYKDLKNKKMENEE